MVGVALHRISQMNIQRLKTGGTASNPPTIIATRFVRLRRCGMEDISTPLPTILAQERANDLNT
jgi:hypothetical protein